MSTVLFAYPPQAEFGRVLPKSKIYEHARPSRGIRETFVEEVDQIVWKYKLAPETINLPARPGVPEIQVFAVSLRTEAASDSVLRTIDKAIQFPIIFELSSGSRIRSVAAYKRPSDADSSKWVVDDYFESSWQEANCPRESLPVALDLAGLYELVLRRLIPLPVREGESIKALVERACLVRSKEAECSKLEARTQQEKQFNRKVVLNQELRSLRNELESLTGQKQEKDASWTN